MAKSRTFPQGLYTPLPTPPGMWLDGITDFVLGLAHTQCNRDSISVLVDLFSKMTHFITYNKANDASHVNYLCFKEVVRLYGIPFSTSLDRDRKFLSHFWITLWGKLGNQVEV